MSATFFDGYNTIREHAAVRGKFSLIEYIRDEWYCGDDCVFAVRLLPCAEDIDEFKTMEEARAFFDLCADTYDEFANSKAEWEILNIIFERSRRTSNAPIVQSAFRKARRLLTK